MRIVSGRFRLFANHEDRSKLWCFEPTDLLSVMDTLRMDDELASLRVQAYTGLGFMEGAKFLPGLSPTRFTG